MAASCSPMSAVAARGPADGPGEPQMGTVPYASAARACMTVDWTEANNNISSARSAAVVEVLPGAPNVIAR